MRRLSIRARLTLVVAATLAVVLAAVGAFVYARVSLQLEEPIQTELSEHAEGIGRAMQRPDYVPGRGPRGVQVLDASGAIMFRTFETPGARLTDAEQVRRALRGAHVGPFTTSGHMVEAVRARFRGKPVVVVTSASLAQREQALSHLRTELILGGLAGLIAVTLAAYLIARRAFEPFETMRREAAAISGAEPGGRLAVPRSDDELARLAVTLNDMLDRLERALAYERRFVAEASHELRTPLAVLRAELELARSRPRSAEELGAALDSVAEEADRLTRLADDLLLLARADEGAIDHRTPVDVAELLESVAARFAVRAQEEHRRIEVDGAAERPIAGDRSALHRAITNLVDNALRHGAGTVSLSALERGGRIEVHVRDEGKGFAPEFLPVAFERFSRGGGERLPQGSGLGLALARAVAVAHGGSAMAGTAADGGADVWLVLPAAKATERDPAQPPATASR